jgi:sulfate permease, SulP family
MKNIYNFSNIKGDLFGGLTAGVVALPLALAFGVMSGMGAAAGLYGAIFTGVFAAVFGGTPSQITGPTAPMTTVVIGLVATAIAAKGEIVAEGGGFFLLIATFILAGIFQVIMGLTGIGKYIRYIPYPVVSGFMSGIGLIILVTQILPFMGVPAEVVVQEDAKGTIGTLSNLNLAIEHINVSSLGLAALTVLIIFLFPKITKAVPSALVALVVVSGISYFFVTDVEVLGKMPEGFPALKVNVLAQLTMSDIGFIIIPAIMLAFLGAIDSLLTSVVADNVTKTKHNSSQELIGQGIGNMVSGMFGGLPGAGATIRTVVNVNNGGKYRLSGVIHGLLLLLVLLGAGPVVMYIPHAVLAGILVTVGISIIDYKGLKDMRFIPVSETVIIISVMGITVFYDLIVAVLIGMMVATIVFMKKMGDITDKKSKIESLDTYKDGVAWDDEKGMPEVLKEKVFIKHLDGPLFFGYKSKFQELYESLPDIKYVVIRMERVPYIDQSGVYALEESLLYLEERGINALITGLQEQPKQLMESLSLVPELIGEDEVFNDFHSCISWLKRILTDSKGALEDNEIVN